jgi:hypothetical protein
MAGIIVGLLWFLFWAIVGAGVVWLVIYGICAFLWAMPQKLIQGVWFLYLLLCIIYLIGVFAGGGSVHMVPHPF